MIRALGAILGRRARDRAHLRRALAAVLHVRLALWRHRLAAVRRRTAALPAERAPGLEDMRLVAWSVAATARAVPGATCLTQALAGQYLLARRGCASVVRLSVSGPAEAPQPHAWLLAGETIVLGGTAAEFRRHRPIADYLASGETRPVPRLSGPSGEVQPGLSRAGEERAVPPAPGASGDIWQGPAGADEERAVPAVPGALRDRRQGLAGADEERAVPRASCQRAGP